MLLAVTPVPPDGAQLYVYVPVPPPAVTVADPLAVLHVASVVLVLSVMAEGSVMFAVPVVEHPCASVMVTV